MLRAEKISYTIDNREILHPVDISLEGERFHVIMGANGAGKSTLLKMLAGSLSPTTGKIFLNDQNIPAYTNRELAVKRAVLSQHYHIGFPVTVQEVVLMGRYPYFSWKPSTGDLGICKEAMQRMEVTDFADRDYNTLSGGEAQKVQMSRVLAQISTADASPRVLFLDEPVSHLDIKYQHQLLRTAKACCQQQVTVVAVLHDINLALQYADRILFMKKGRIIHDLAGMYSIEAGIIKEVFDIEAAVIQNPQTNRPVIVFH